MGYLLQWKYQEKKIIYSNKNGEQKVKILHSSMHVPKWLPISYTIWNPLFPWSKNFNLQYSLMPHPKIQCLHKVIHNLTQPHQDLYISESLVFHVYVHQIPSSLHPYYKSTKDPQALL